jgi:uncharacterized protein
VSSGGQVSSAGQPAQTAPRGPVAPSSAADCAHLPLGGLAGNDAIAGEGVTAGAGDGARLTRGLLAEWQQRNLSASLPLALRQLENAGNLDNVRLAIRVGDEAAAASAGTARRGLSPVDPLPGLGYRGPVFMDSDIYKTLEAIGWELAHGQDAKLRSFASDAIALLEQAQRPDGYLDSYFQVSGEPRYTRLAWSHEMYCAGHLIQAAVAFRRGAGDDRLLGVATRLADHLVDTFLGKDKGLDGHPIIETALAELYRETGQPGYLDLARQFVDQRGNGLAGESSMGHRYLQDHLPVRVSPTEVGHVVRALYLEAGVADIAAETGDRELLDASIRRWDDMVAAKTYLTGGNGSRHSDEGFGDRFELPPDRAYNETCAAIASFQWSWRLLLATGDPRYADHMERVLYNGFAASISRDGQRFFYVNPLQRRADHYENDDPGRRREWFDCACCPPNIMRLLASLEHYLATTAGDTMYVHQLTGSVLRGAGLAVEVTTEYPWDGRVQLRVTAAPPTERGLAVRVPGWAESATYHLNHDPERSLPPGYLRLHRVWAPGDVMTLDLALTPRWTTPDRRVDAVRDCVAVERGPLVYCFEQADQPGGVAVDDLTAPTAAPLAEHAVTLPAVGPTVQVTADATHVTDGAPVSATAIPYFQWDNRDGDAMRVWLPRHH